jgi:thymidylate kinase
MVPVALSESRRLARAPQRDRMEEAGRAFFKRVEKGYKIIATAEPGRIRLIDAAATMEMVAGEIWSAVAPLLKPAKKSAKRKHRFRKGDVKINATRTLAEG